MMVYHHREVNDLAWVITSPPLLDLPELNWQAPEVDHAWLSLIDRDPTFLQTAIQQMKRQTLGSYFETLVAFWLSHHPGIIIKSLNLQVKEDKATIGEFDMIIQHRAQLIHLELSVKFYLQIQPTNEWQSWVGTLLQDRLDIKMDRLLHHQLPLSRLPAAKEQLTKAELYPVESKLLLKGYFFYPFRTFFAGVKIAPHHANPHHLSGWWCHMGEMGMLNDFKNCRWKILKKPSWLSLAREQDNEELLEYAALTDLLLIHPPQKGILVAAMEYHHDIWIEVHRGFILNDSWPDFP